MENSTKPRRPNFQPYIPVHRRNQQEHSSAPASPTQSRSLIREDSDVKRRGRGQFRAPSTDDKTNDNIDQITTTLENVDIEQKDEPEDWEEDWESADIDVKTVHPVKKPVKTTPNFNQDEITTVLDCYDFPSSFKTHHLQDLFKDYEQLKGGYSIKWMDDTRALIIFEHADTARKAFIGLCTNPLVKVRPYKGQIEQRSSGPVPKRPVTTDMVARRLVHGALGVRSIKTAEQRQAEKELIKSAKEKRQAEKANNALRAQQIANAFDE